MYANRIISLELARPLVALGLIEGYHTSPAPLSSDICWPVSLLVVCVLFLVPTDQYDIYIRDCIPSSELHGSCDLMPDYPKMVSLSLTRGGGLLKA